MEEWAEGSEVVSQRTNSGFWSGKMLLGRKGMEVLGQGKVGGGRSQ